MSITTFTEAFQKDNDPQDFQDYLAKAFSANILREELCNPDSHFYFVHHNDKLVGYFKLNFNSAQTDIKLKDTVELERIYVVKAHQGKKIGAAILSKVKGMVSNTQKSFLWLGVWEHNVNAIKFYKKHGFYQFGTHPYFIGKDEQTDWLMRFDLVNFNSQ
ncbi:GNAT family N-acetyltransferase [Maribacter sp. CXY002]|uniref:GNAT family N-acetyltransferase n=1 Tax=Maribacter luteocoastalis TaxID=3407671 RepID=UPI003B681405